MALKDQQLSMQWVKNNIQSFGGNPNKILLFGESVGGASAGYHMFNDQSKKLFNRVYSLGGSPLNAYARMQFNDLSPILRAATNFKLNMTTDDQLIQAIKTIPTASWINYTYVAPAFNQRTRYPTWAPIIESKFFPFSNFFERWKLHFQRNERWCFEQVTVKMFRIVISGKNAANPFITRDPLDMYRNMHSCYDIPATISTYQTMVTMR